MKACPGLPQETERVQLFWEKSCRTIINNWRNFAEVVGRWVSERNPTNYAWTLLSAKAKDNIQGGRDLMIPLVQRFADSSVGQLLISNVRHLDALRKAQVPLEEVRDGLKGGLLSIARSVRARGKIEG